MTELAQLTANLAAQHVTVVGDVMLDHFIVGRVDRISPEAPVPVVRFEREEFRLGGAANVAHNLGALGGQVTLVGLLGLDEGASQVRRQLQTAGVADSALVDDRSRPTTRKTRVVTSRNQQVARIDHESEAPVAGDSLVALIEQVVMAAGRSGAVILSDYRKGVVVPAVIAAAVAATATRGIPLLIDPKIAHADRYRGATLITPNHHEAELMTQMTIRTDDDARAAARKLHEHTGASVLITRGEQGMWVFDGAREPTIEVALPAVAREVADVTGAGDTVIAVLALALASGASLVDAARLANLAAGLVVARFGPATVTCEELTIAARARPA